MQGTNNGGPPQVNVECYWCNAPINENAKICKECGKYRGKLVGYIQQWTSLFIPLVTLLIAISGVVISQKQLNAAKEEKAESALILEKADNARELADAAQQAAAEALQSAQITLEEVKRINNDVNAYRDDVTSIVGISTSISIVANARNFSAEIIGSDEAISNVKKMMQAYDSSMEYLRMGDVTYFNVCMDQSLNIANKATTTPGSIKDLGEKLSILFSLITKDDYSSTCPNAIVAIHYYRFLLSTVASYQGVKHKGTVVRSNSDGSIKISGTDFNFGTIAKYMVKFSPAIGQDLMEKVVLSEVLFGLSSNMRKTLLKEHPSLQGVNVKEIRYRICSKSPKLCKNSKK